MKTNTVGIHYKWHTEALLMSTHNMFSFKNKKNVNMFTF